MAPILREQEVAAIPPEQPRLDHDTIIAGPVGEEGVRLGVEGQDKEGSGQDGDGREDGMAGGEHERVWKFGWIQPDNASLREACEESVFWQPGQVEWLVG